MMECGTVDEAALRCSSSFATGALGHFSLPCPAEISQGTHATFCYTQLSRYNTRAIAVVVVVPCCGAT